MQFVLLILGTISPAEVTYITKFFAVIFWHGTRNDVHVVGYGQIRHPVYNFGGIVCQVSDCFGCIHVIELRKHGGIEKFRQQTEIRLVARHGVYVKFHLLHQVIHI